MKIKIEEESQTKDMKIHWNLLKNKGQKSSGN